MEKFNQEFRDRQIAITSDIEGGNAYDFKKYPGNVYSFTPRRDPGENYSGQVYYFKLQIENLQKDIAHVTVTAIADYDETWKGWQASLNPKIWIFSSNRLKIPEILAQDRVKATPRSMSINLTLQPFEKIIISNMFTPPYSELVQELHDLADSYPTFLKLNEIGQSPLGNQMYSIRVNPQGESDNLFKILVGGTSQPNEFGDYAAISILQGFLDMGADFWDNFTTKFLLEFIFFQNPDGMVQGMNMVNANQENLFFSYFHKNQPMPLENEIIWNHIKTNPPDLYLEMHSFFQDHKTIQPYIYPLELLSEKKNQKFYLKLAKALVKYSNGMKEEIHLNQKYFQDTLCYRLMEKFQTHSFQYKLHSGMSINQKKQTAWDVFYILIKNLKKMV